jgi:hypothetical protein
VFTFVGILLLILIFVAMFIFIDDSEINVFISVLFIIPGIVLFLSGVVYNNPIMFLGVLSVCVSFLYFYSATNWQTPAETIKDAVVEIIELLRKIDRSVEK